MTVLSEDCKTEIRRQCAETLRSLKEEAENAAPPSWVRSDGVPDANGSALRRFFDLTGFYHISAFSSEEECKSLKQKMAELVETCWNPEKDGIDSFGTDDTQNTARGDYFLESADKLHFFAEPEALLDDGLLKESFLANKLTALNKAGHAMHIQEGPFRDYCLSEKILQLVTDLGWRDPVVPQSMYIFKQAFTGGVVNSHQDSTFLYTFPKQTCLGLWLALDDANLDNGCLWVRPKSHNERVRRQYKRNPAHFGQDSIETRSNEATGDFSQPKFVMENLHQHDIIWEGSLPEDGWKGLLKAGFVPVECKAGDLVTFCGELDHLSLPNYSSKPRHTFQLHLIEGSAEEVEWSNSNWLQYPEGKPFISLLRKGR